MEKYQEWMRNLPWENLDQERKWRNPPENVANAAAACDVRVKVFKSSYCEGKD